MPFFVFYLFKAKTNLEYLKKTLIMMFMKVTWKSGTDTGQRNVALLEPLHQCFVALILSLLINVTFSFSFYLILLWYDLKNPCQSIFTLFPLDICKHVKPISGDPSILHYVNRKIKTSSPIFVRFICFRQKYLKYTFAFFYIFGCELIAGSKAIKFIQDPVDIQSELQAL